MIRMSSRSCQHLVIDIDPAQRASTWLTAASPSENSTSNWP
jgi:hypothetical protein